MITISKWKTGNGERPKSTLLVQIWHLFYTSIYIKIVLFVFDMYKYYINIILLFLFCFQM